MRIQAPIVLSMIALMTFVETACGPAPSHSNKQREIEDREALATLYQSVSGTYLGRVENRPDGSDPFEIEVKIFVVEEQNGVNEEGEAKFRPALRARYRRLDIVSDGSFERTLIVRYYRETGELAAATNPNMAMMGGLQDSNFLSMSGKLMESETTVEVRDHRGVLGTARLAKQVEPSK